MLRERSSPLLPGWMVPPVLPWSQGLVHSPMCHDFMTVLLGFHLGSSLEGR